MPRLFFVRHGEAEHNPFIVQGKAENNEELLLKGRRILNPSLTHKGRAQAEELCKQLEESKQARAVGRGQMLTRTDNDLCSHPRQRCPQVFDLLITSPLARAVETAHIAFGNAAKRFIILPELVETAEPRLGGPQRGASVAMMLQRHPFLKEWDLSHIEEGTNWILGEQTELCPAAYHHPLPVEDRLAPLRSYLAARQEGSVVVVGHSMVFDRLLGKQMKNCELVEHALSG